MKSSAPSSFGAQLKALREAAGFTQEELATIAGLSVHAVSALERGERRRPHVETVRALSAALDLADTARDAFVASARAPAHATAVDEFMGAAVPVPPTALLGREPDMRALRGWLLDPAVRLVTLTGPGGAGKTRLALELARVHAEEQASPVFFVALAGIRNATSVPAAIAEATLGVGSTADDLPRRVRALCGITPTLLVLDNFEQVLEAAPLVADLLAAAPALRLLVTSRAPLRLRGEREYPVGPLTIERNVDASSPADLARCPAVRLFVERVRDALPEFRLTAANGPVVMEICERIDALPLALELTAPWIKVLSVEQLLGHLRHDVLFSTDGPRDLPERQRTINATVAWSYQLLAPDDQRVFRRLGVLPDRFPIAAAAAVVGGREGASATDPDTLRSVAGLIDKSLLMRIEGAFPARPLYEMLETIRAYAALEVAAAGEREDALEGLARYCLGEASLAATGLVGPEQAEWLDRVRDDLETYRTALTWLIEHNRAGDASEIAWSLAFFWMIRGHIAEGLQWYERIASLPSLTAAVESKAVMGAGLMWYEHGELARARTMMTHGLALAETACDTAMAAWGHLVLGHIEHFTSNFDAARVRYHHALELLNGATTAMGWARGNTLNGLAAGALAAGELDDAERLADEAAIALRDSGPWFLAIVSTLRAFLAVRRGNPDAAIGFVRESLGRIGRMRERFLFMSMLIPLAAAAAAKGNDAWAARILGVRDALLERTGIMLIDRAFDGVKEHTERDLRGRLGSERWARAHAAGRKLSIDALLKEIDRAVNS